LSVLTNSVLFRRFLGVDSNGANVQPFDLTGIVAMERCSGLELSARRPANRWDEERAERMENLARGFGKK
jgi:hypothetical protein